MLGETEYFNATYFIPPGFDVPYQRETYFRFKPLPLTFIINVTLRNRRGVQMGERGGGGAVVVPSPWNSRNLLYYLFCLQQLWRHSHTLQHP